MSKIVKNAFTAVIGPRNDLGKPVDVNEAADHIFGLS